MLRDYRLQETQASYLKKRIREIAAEHGVIWGWYPPLNRHILAPHNRPDIAREILSYVLHHWKDAGANADLTFQAAEKQGYLSSEWRNQISAMRDEMDRRINRILFSLGYVDKQAA
jgi:hypothetical protein